ncbi:hypothetical protein EVAR_96434_1 [Eumeta japonica]|uniref:Uncharacterized protein n=1 Tax=Eumeta variegata TaxID=151549 RepID=A0A4C2AFD8_EUMVA|nr:hypothetical protein EVAR_96434_1 [Eumeta japonica]
MAEARRPCRTAARTSTSSARRWRGRSLLQKQLDEKIKETTKGRAPKTHSRVHWMNLKKRVNPSILTLAVLGVNSAPDRAPVIYVNSDVWSPRSRYSNSSLDAYLGTFLAMDGTQNKGQAAARQVLAGHRVRGDAVLLAFATGSTAKLRECYERQWELTSCASASAEEVPATISVSRKPRLYDDSHGAKWDNSSLTRTHGPDALSKLALIAWIGGLTESIILSVNENNRLIVALMLMLWLSYYNICSIVLGERAGNHQRIDCLHSTPEGITSPLPDSREGIGYLGEGDRVDGRGGRRVGHRYPH